MVYCDGANMNAVMGIVDMKTIGIDVLHLNLHKTFSTPPRGRRVRRSGPVCVTRDPGTVSARTARGENRRSILRLSDENFPESIGKMSTRFTGISASWSKPTAIS